MIIISIIIILIIFIIIFIYVIIVENPKINNYITNKINKLPFFTIMEFRNKYPNLQSSTLALSTLVLSTSLPSTLPIYIFYHVGITGNYENLINDQLNEIFYSGLYEKCDTIYYGCNGKNSDVILKDFFAPYKKIKPLEFADDASKSAIAPNEKTYENKTINAMIKFAKDAKDPFYGLYIHTKGMTHNKRSNGQWRKHMEYWLIKKHELCIDILNRGFNTVGTGLIQKHPIWTPNGIQNLFIKNKWKQSYCGNFYWFSNNYLKKCNYIDNIYNRLFAEYFLFKKYEKNKHINLDTIRYDYLTLISGHLRYYPFPINNIIKIGIY